MSLRPALWKGTAGGEWVAAQIPSEGFGFQFGAWTVFGLMVSLACFFIPMRTT